jgi:small GTP-binding protein
VCTGESEIPVAVLQKKVCLLGDFAVGKTSLVRRFVHDLFSEKYLTTVGVKVSLKKVAIPHDGKAVELTMMLWDLAGSEEFDQVRTGYLRGASGALLVCDLTRPESLASLSQYANQLLSLNPGAQLVVAANKLDLNDQRRFSVAEVEEVAKLNASYYLTSAKVGTDVETFFRHLGRLLIA